MRTDKEKGGRHTQGPTSPDPLSTTSYTQQSAAAGVVSYTPCGRRSEMPIFMATTEGAQQMLIEGKV